MQDFLAKSPRAKRRSRRQQMAAEEAFFRSLVARGLAKETPVDPK